MTSAALSVRFADASFEVEPGTRFRVRRGDDVDLTVREPDVSRHHAVFYFADGWWVDDERSANGTFVDGLRIEGPTPIRSEEGAAVYASDLRATDLDDDRVVATVISRPATGALALWNRSDEIWTFDRESGRTAVPPGSAVVARAGDGLRVPGTETVRFVD